MTEQETMVERVAKAIEQAFSLQPHRQAALDAARVAIGPLVEWHEAQANEFVRLARVASESGDSEAKQRCLAASFIHHESANFMRREATQDAVR